MDSRYGRVLQQFVFLSRRLDFERAPSVLRACLMLSATEFMNVVTGVLLWESATRSRLPLSQSAFLATIAGLVALNFLFASKRPKADWVLGSQGRMSFGLLVYVGMTLLLLVIAKAIHLRVM